MLQFYPTAWYGSVRESMPVRQYVLATSSWARFRRKDGSIRPAHLPSAIKGCAVDPGAFAAAQSGGYTYAFPDYLQWLTQFEPGQIAWAGTMDFCCIGDPSAERKHRDPPWLWEAAGGDYVRAQQIKTTVNAYEAFGQYSDMQFPWVPTLQGQTTEQYIAHAYELRDLIVKMQAFYGKDSAYRVGIGSLVRPMPPGLLHEIIRGVSNVLPEGIRFHLWGVKLQAIQRLPMPLPECVISCDSSMWSGQQKRVAGRGSVKLWKASGKKQMEFAYNHLPVYEEEIRNALTGIRPQEALWSPVEATPTAASPQAIRQLAVQRFLRAVQGAEEDPDDLPYPYEVAWGFDWRDQEEWFMN